MNEKAEGKKQRFQLLLEQLNLKNQELETYFYNAEIDKLTVLRKEKSGIFILRLSESSRRPFGDNCSSSYPLLFGKSRMSPFLQKCSILRSQKI